MTKRTVGSTAVGVAAVKFYFDSTEFTCFSR